MAGSGAAQLLGIDQIPTIRLETLSEEQIRAYLLADNKLAENAGWDESILAIELQHLIAVDLGFDITVTGFEVPEIDLILQQAEAKPDADDAFDAPSGPAISQLGDLWLLGKHRIYCGNSLEELSYQKLMEGHKADAVFVDPPYNVVIDDHVSGNGSIRHREFEMASGEMTKKEFVNFLSASFGLLVRHSKPGSVHFACMDWGHAGEILAAGKQAYESLLNLCVWAKDKGEWDPSTGPSTNAALSSGMEKNLIGTMFSSGNSGATVPMSGSTRERTRCPGRVRKAISLHYTRP